MKRKFKGVNLYEKHNWKNKEDDGNLTEPDDVSYEKLALKKKKKRAKSYFKGAKFPGSTCTNCRNAHVLCERINNDEIGISCRRCAQFNFNCQSPRCINCINDQLLCDGHKPCDNCLENDKKVCVFDYLRGKKKKPTSVVNSIFIPSPMTSKVSAETLYKDWIENGMYTKELLFKYQLQQKTWRKEIEAIVKKGLLSENMFNEKMAAKLLRSIKLVGRVKQRRKKDEYFDITTMILPDDIKRLTDGMKYTGQLIGLQYAVAPKAQMIGHADPNIRRLVTTHMSTLHNIIDGQPKDWFENRSKLNKNIVLSSIELVQDMLKGIYKTYPIVNEEYFCEEEET